MMREPGAAGRSAPSLEKLRPIANLYGGRDEGPYHDGLYPRHDDLGRYMLDMRSIAGNGNMTGYWKKSVRRSFGSAAVLVLAACSVAAQAASYTMFRDPNCGCCEAWAAHVREELSAEIAVQNSADMAAIKDREGVPGELRSCHTMIVDGYVIEGHVPAADIGRLLRERPAGVEGLAVAGMPIGSPGMEMGGRTQPYQVVAFGKAGRTVFNTYKGS